MCDSQNIMTLVPDYKDQTTSSDRLVLGSSAMATELQGASIHLDIPTYTRKFYILSSYTNIT